MDAELAHEVILDHDLRPRNFGKLSNATHSSEGYSPLCGDSYTVTLQLADGRIQELCFHGFGCAISKASASVMTERLAGLTPEEARAQAQDLERALLDESTPALEDLGDMAAFLGLRTIPTRAGCALLPWRTLTCALDGLGRVEIL